MANTAPVEMDELPIAATLLEDLGFRLSDFDLEPTIRQSETPVGSWKWGTILVRQLSTGIQRTYTVGLGPSWLLDFETDLRRNVFALP